MADTRTATLDHRRTETYELPIYSPTAGPDVIDIGKLYAQAGCSPTTRASPRPRPATATITFIDGDKGELLHRGYPIDQLAEKSHFLEVCYLLLYGELPTPPTAGGFRDHDHPPHHAARADAELLPRVPPRCASDGDMVGVVGAMSAFYHDSTDINDPAARDRGDPADRQDADHRRLGLQVHDRPALRVSAQRPRLCRELPAHVLCGPGRGIRGQPDPEPRDGPDLHAACRPRAERLDLDGAARLLVRAPTRSPASRPASPASGARPMAAPTRPAWRCCARSARPTASPNTSPAPRTRTIRSA
jgi:hypothetical protein